MSVSTIRSVVLLLGIVLNLVASVFLRPRGADGKRRRGPAGVVVTKIAGVCVVCALVLMLLGD